MILNEFINFVVRLVAQSCYIDVFAWICKTFIKKNNHETIRNEPDKHICALHNGQQRNKIVMSSFFKFLYEGFSSEDEVLINESTTLVTYKTNALLSDLKVLYGKLSGLVIATVVNDLVWYKNKSLVAFRHIRVINMV